MSQRLSSEAEERARSAPSPHAAGVLDGTTSADDSGLEAGHTAVFPTPQTTAVAIGLGGTLGFATVYGLSALQANPLFGVAVIIGLFAVAIGGLKHITDARTEAGRAFAVALNAMTIGGTLGGLTVLV